MNLRSLLNTGAALLAVYCSGIAFAGGEGWSSDFAAAKKEAAASSKDLLMDFTGSDWCGWCIKLNKEVFSQEPFKTGVKDKFVLVELDFPKDKSKLTAETLKQNQELGEKYRVKGYPSILLCDAEGRPFATTGYEKGGPEAYVKHLDGLRERKAARDKAFESAAKAQGVDKAKALVAGLAAMGLDDAIVLEFYGDVVAQIKAADPDDTAGFGKAAASNARLEEFKGALGSFIQKKDFDGALALVDKTLKDGGFGPEETQQFMMTRAMIFAGQKNFDKAIQAVDEAKAFAPDSKMAAGIDSFKARLETAKKEAEGGKPATGE